MFEESALISHIISETGYSCVLAKENNIHDNYESLTDNDLAKPKVYVGHAMIKTHGLSLNDIYANSFREIPNEKILITAVQFICLRSDFVTVETAISNACSGWNPFPLEGDYGTLIYIESEPVKPVGNKVWWRSYYGMIFPRFT